MSSGLELLSQEFPVQLLRSLFKGKEGAAGFQGTAGMFWKVRGEHSRE